LLALTTCGISANAAEFLRALKPSSYEKSKLISSDTSWTPHRRCNYLSHRLNIEFWTFCVVSIFFYTVQSFFSPFLLLALTTSSSIRPQPHWLLIALSLSLSLSLSLGVPFIVNWHRGLPVAQPRK
jgi:hypothetical protein